jgi:hypothetical protein
MSLLDRGTEHITIYPEEVVTDIDGNTRTQPSKTGYCCRATIQPQGQSGTASRRAEQDNEGFESERVYTMRLPRHAPVVGAQAQIEWRGARWAVFGDPFFYTNSRRTRHMRYTIKRY